MNKESILFGIIGLLLGLIVGFMFANSVNQRGASGAIAQGTVQQSSALPPDHPPIGSNTAPSAPDAQTVQAAVDRAKAEPSNFEAQMKAAEYKYQSQQLDEAIEFYTRANQLKPDHYDAIVQLGNTNFDASRFEEAGKWYSAALEKQPDDISVRTDLGLTFMFREPADLDRAIVEFRGSLERDPKHMQTLQNLSAALTRKGDREQALATLVRLEEVSPGNPAIATLRAELDKPRSLAAGKSD